MSSTDLEGLLRLAERRVLLTALRGHPEWTLGHVFSYLERGGGRAPLLGDLSLGELLEDPRLDQIGLPADGAPRSRCEEKHS